MRVTKKSDIDTVIRKFRLFLEVALDGEVHGRTIIVEIR
jgi:hypothetical protein